MDYVIWYGLNSLVPVLISGGILAQVAKNRRHKVGKGFLFGALGGLVFSLAFFLTGGWMIVGIILVAANVAYLAIMAKKVFPKTTLTYTKRT